MAATEGSAIRSADELEFAVFAVEGVASRLGISGAEAYRVLSDGADVLHRYIVPSYGALHTQGRDYVVDDALRALAAAGVRA